LVFLCQQNKIEWLGNSPINLTIKVSLLKLYWVSQFELSLSMRLQLPPTPD
jgi:hypothetical protein